MTAFSEDRSCIEELIVVPAPGELEADLLGTWNFPGWRIRMAAGSEGVPPGEPGLRFEWIEWPSRFRVFFGPDHPYEARLAESYRIDWENGLSWYKGNPLYSAEQRIYSQNGEDGVLLALLDALGVRHPTALEFGAGDGSECNTRILAERGHETLCWDRSHHAPSRGLYRELVTLGNIPSLVARYAVPNDLDVLSIDVDYYDFFFWWRISELLSPRLVIVEHNGSHGPDEDLVVQYEGPDRSWDGTRYFGASLLALQRLGERLGFVLVYAESAGVNAFFVRRKDAARLRELAPLAGDVGRIYRPARYGCGGHPPDPLRRAYTSSTALFASSLSPWDPG
jgi:hypothetical protein